MKLKQSAAPLLAALCGFCQTSLAAPANDEFADRATLEGALPIMVTVDTTDATSGGEDPSTYASQQLTVWYEWTPASDGLYAVSMRKTSDEGGNSWRLAVLEDVPGGRRVISQSVQYSHWGFHERLYFRGAAGTAYKFVFGSKSPGEFEISVQNTAAPAAGVVDLGNAVPVTVERGAGFVATALDWTWTAPQDGLYVLDYFEGLQLTGVRPEFWITDAGGNPTEPLFAEYWAVVPNGSGYWYFRAKAATQYHITAPAEEAYFVLDRLPDAPHSKFAQAQDLGAALSFTVRGHTAQGELEPFERVNGGLLPGGIGFGVGSQWWKWRAPAAGLYRITSRPVRMASIDDFWYPPQARVFTGESPELLRLVPTSPSWWHLNFGYGGEEVTYVFKAHYPGEEFKLGLLNIIEGTGPYRVGQWEIELEVEPGAANDGFENAFTLVIDAGEAEPWTGHFATLQAGEPTPSTRAPDVQDWQFVDQPPLGSLWWRWQAPDDTPVEFQAEGGFIDIYTGASLATLQGVGSLTESPRGHRKAIIPVAGQTYFVQLAGVLSTGTIEALSRPDLAAPPANDDWANAVTIDLTGKNLLGINASCATATAEAGEPDHLLLPGAAPAARSRWWKWTADRVALVEFGYRDGVLAVYRGDSLASLQREPGWGTASVARSSTSLRVRSEVGETYYIALDDGLASLDEALFSIAAAPIATPQNDEVGGRLTLERGNLRPGIEPLDVHHNLAGRQATVDDPNEPVPTMAGARQTTWFSWVSDSNQPVAISLNAARLPDGTVPFSADVYRLDALGWLERVGAELYAFPDAQPFTLFTGVPGVEYFVAVSSLPEGSTATVSIADAHPRILSRVEWLKQFPELVGADTAERASPAGDGIANIIKRALGLNPLIHAHSGHEPKADHLPILERLPDGRVRLVYTLDPLYSEGLTIRGQASENGSFWGIYIDPVELEDGRQAIYLPMDRRQLMLWLRVD